MGILVTVDFEERLEKFRHLTCLVGTERATNKSREVSIFLESRILENISIISEEHKFKFGIWNFRSSSLGHQYSPKNPETTKLEKPKKLIFIAHISRQLHLKVHHEKYKSKYLGESPPLSPPRTFFKCIENIFKILWKFLKVFVM